MNVEEFGMDVEEAVAWSLRAGLTWCISPGPPLLLCALGPLCGGFKGIFLVGWADEMSFFSVSKGFVR